MGVSFSPDGHTLAAGFRESDGGRNGVALWNVSRRETQVGRPSRARELRRAPGRDLSIGFVTYSAPDGGVVIWDAVAQQALTNPHLFPGKQYASFPKLSPDGRSLALTLRSQDNRESSLILWDIEHGIQLTDAPIRIPNFEVFDTEFSPDGQSLALGLARKGQLPQRQQYLMIWSISSASG